MIRLWYNHYIINNDYDHIPKEELKMVRCDDCGWIGEPEELRKVRESRGEFWGMPAYETMSYCPCCGSDFIEDYDGTVDSEDVDIDEVAEDEYYRKLGAFDTI